MRNSPRASAGFAPASGLKGGEDFGKEFKKVVNLYAQVDFSASSVAYVQFFNLPAGNHGQRSNLLRAKRDN